MIVSYTVGPAEEPKAVEDVMVAILEAIVSFVTNLRT